MMIAGLARAALGAALLLAQAGEPRLRTEIDAGEISIGDRVQLTVEVEHAPGTRVAWPDSIDLAPFEALELVVAEPRAAGDRSVSEARYTLTVFELGELEIPSFEVAVLSVDGSSATTLETDVWIVTVVSVGLDEAGDIRDIKSPLSIPLGWLVVLGWVALLFALVALAFWVYRRYQAGLERGPPIVVAPTKAPHELAYEALDRLEASDLLETGETKAYYIQASEIIRTYIDARYGVDAMEMASHEVLEGLEACGVDIETRLEFESYFRDSDLVKFAKRIPALEECRRHVPAARTLVDITKEMELTEAGVEAAAAVTGGGDL